MSAENSKQGGRKVKHKKHTALWVSVGIGVLLLVLVLILPVFVSSRAGETMILGKINGAVTGKADFANLSMGWWRGITVDDFSFEDTGGRTSVKAKQIHTKPHYGSILFGNLSFGKTVIDEPEVNLSLADRRAGPGTQGRNGRAGGAVAGTGLPVKEIDLTIRNGTVRVSAGDGKTATAAAINSQLQLHSYGRSNKFDLQMMLGGARVDAKGSSQFEVKDRRLKGFSGSFSVEADKVSLSQVSTLMAAAGIDVEAEGLVSTQIVCDIGDGRVKHLTGSIKGSSIDVGGELLGGRSFRTGRLIVNARMSGPKGQIDIEVTNIETDWLKGRLKAVVPEDFDSAAFFEPDSPYTVEAEFECDVAEAMSQMPQTLGVKEAVTVTSGLLTGRVRTVAKPGVKLLSGDAKLEGLAGVVDGRQVSLSGPVTAEAEVASDANVLKFEKVDISAPFAKVSCSGTSELLRHEEQLDLGKLQAELGQFLVLGGYEMGGRYSGGGEISVSKKQVGISGTSVVEDFELRSAEGASAAEPKANLEFLVRVDRDANLVDINSINLTADFGRVTIKEGVVPFGEAPAKSMKLDIGARDIDLSKVGAFAVLFGYVRPEVGLSGLADSEVVVSREDGAYRIASEATRIKNLKVEYPEKTPFETGGEVSAVFDVKVGPMGRSGSIELVSPQIKIKGNFEHKPEGDRSKLQGNAALEYDWAKLSNLAAGYLPSGLELEGRRNETLEFSSEYPAARAGGLLANLTAKGKLGFARAGFKGLEFGATEVPVEIENGTLRIEPFTTTVNNGRLTLGADANLAEKPVLLKMPRPMQVADDIELNKELGQELLAFLNPLFADFTQISGVADFNCQQMSIPLGKARREQIVVAGTISMDRLSIQGSELLGAIFALFSSGVPAEEFRLHPTEFEVRDGLVRYKDMQIDVGDNPLNFGGVIGLDSTIRNMTVTLPYTYSGETVRVGRETKGQRIAVPLKGTLKKPELDAGRLLEDQLKRQLEEQLKKKVLEGLGELFK